MRLLLLYQRDCCTNKARHYFHLRDDGKSCWRRMGGEEGDHSYVWTRASINNSHTGDLCDPSS